jgi:rhodanese-related sulfurtransferase
LTLRVAEVVRDLIFYSWRRPKIHYVTLRYSRKWFLNIKTKVLSWTRRQKCDGQNMKSARIVLLLASWLAISFPLTTLAGHEEDWIDTIPADRLKRLLDSGVKLFLVDLRPSKEFQQSRLPGAHSIPSTELASRLAEIPKNVRVVLYCACQKHESSDRAVFLKSQGYRNISIMLEDYTEWVKRGYPVEPNRP